MLLVEYGHAQIKWGDEVFTLSPSLINISKLGSKTEIVELLKVFMSPFTRSITKFGIAIDVLNACSDRPLPHELTGSTEFSEKRGILLYRKPRHNLPMFEDCITLAEHMIVHGIIGNVEGDEDGEPMTEFDAYKVMEVAMEHLSLSRDDSANMTMTEFIRRMQLKYPTTNKKASKQKAISEFDAMIAWRKEQDKKEREAKKHG